MHVQMETIIDALLSWSVIIRGQSHVGGVNAGVEALLKPAVTWHTSRIMYFAIAIFHNILLLCDYKIVIVDDCKHRRQQDHEL